jgi:hypothetical protein
MDITETGIEDANWLQLDQYIFCLFFVYLIILSYYLASNARKIGDNKFQRVSNRVTMA